MKKQPQKTTIQPKINADLPIQPLTDLESSQLSGGAYVNKADARPNSYQSWAG